MCQCRAGQLATVSHGIYITELSYLYTSSAHKAECREGQLAAVSRLCERGCPAEGHGERAAAIGGDHNDGVGGR